MHLEMSVSKILDHRLQNYQNVIEMTSNMICIVALGVGLKCPRKIRLNKQYPFRICRPIYGPAPPRPMCAYKNKIPTKALTRFDTNVCIKVI